MCHQHSVPGSTRHLILLGLVLPCLVLPGLILPSAATASLADSGFNDEVLALTIYQGELIAGGRFTMSGDTEVHGIARWLNGAWHPLGAGVEGDQFYWDTTGDSIPVHPHVTTMTEYRGDLVVGGSFTTAGGNAMASIARWDGSEWHPLSDGITEHVSFYSTGRWYYFPPAVHTLTVHEDSLHVGGVFEQAGDVSANYIATWDGTDWYSLGFGTGGGRPTRVLTSIVFEGDLILGGHFTQAGMTSAPYLALWDDVRWGVLNQGLGPIEPNTQAICMTIFGSDLIVGGQFSTAGTVPAQNIASNTVVGWSALGQGLPNPVHALAVYQNELYAGAYRFEGGVWINRLQTDGVVRAMTVYLDKLIVGGDFNLIDGVPCQHIAAWPDDLTPLYFMAFSATRLGTSAQLEWQLGYSPAGLDASLFSVWRQLPGQDRTHLGGPIQQFHELGFGFVDEAPPAGGADYWLQYTDENGQMSWYGPASLTAGLPARLNLAPNHPNPFNPRTSFSFTLAVAGQTRLVVYDLQGRPVRILREERLNAGEHTASWDGLSSTGQATASGVYVVRLETASGSLARKITLAR